MNALIAQTVVLIVGAFLLGACTACLLRWIMSSGKAAASPSMWQPKPAEPVSPSVGSGLRAATPAPAASSADARRFERALAGESPASVPAQVAVKPATPAAAPDVTANAAASAARTVAAAAAAAAAVQRAASPAVAKSAVHPSATGSSGPAMVSTQVSMAPAKAEVPLPTDDLTRIRGIDAALAQKIAGLGVTRFQQMADLTSRDVQRVSAGLGLKGRIQQENWIEQAQILAKGGVTAYVAKAAPAAVPLAAPTPHEGEQKTLSVAAAPPAKASPPPPVAKPVAAPAPPSQPVVAASSPKVAERAAFATRPASTGPATAPVMTAAAGAPAAAVAAAIASGMKVAPAAVPSSPPPAATPAAQPAAAAAPAPAVAASPPGPPASAAAAAAAAATAAAQVARSAVVSGPTAASAAPVVALVASNPQAAGASPPRGDNLQRIRGVNSEVEKLLHLQGVTRFAQIANWSSADVERFDRHLGYEGRIGRENWIEQAHILNRDSGSTPAGGGAKSAPAQSPAEPLRPGRAPEASADTKSPAATEAAPSGSPAPRSDLTGLRSVRSEAYRGGEAAPRRAGEVDDLKRIRGIGVLIEKKLNAMSVTGYVQIANWSAGDIDKVSQTLDFKGRIERENWVEQARILASGGQTEFSRRVDRGDPDAGKNKP